MTITRQHSGEPRLGDGTRTDLRAPLALVDIQVIENEEPPPRQGPGSSRGKGQPEKARVQGSALRRHLATGDVIALTAAWGAQLLSQPHDRLLHQAALAAVAVVVTLLTMHRGGLYRSRICALRSLEALRVLTSSVVGTCAFIALEALSGPVKLDGPAEAGGAAVVGVLALRWRFNRWLKGRRSVSKFLRTVVLVGTNEDAEGLWAILSEEPELGYRVGGLAGEGWPDHSAERWASLPYCSRLENLGELAEQVGANGVIVVASALGVAERIKAVDLAQAAGLHVQVWPGLYGLSSRRTRMAPVSGLPLIYVEPKRAATWELVAKRGMDLVMSAAFIVLFTPLAAVAALAIKMADGGPIIHRSQRVGRDGKTIAVLKLRTMVPGADSMMLTVESLNERKGGPLFKASDDPRVTKIGRILRATSIDELPQLLNVLSGTMSLVGPRPALLHEVEHFDDELRRRHEMRPGITGLWQVEARDNPSFNAYRRLDLSYVDDWSLGLDIAILASTAHEMVARAFKAFVQLATRRHAQEPVHNLAQVTPAAGPTEEAQPGVIASGELA